MDPEARQEGARRSQNNQQHSHAQAVEHEQNLIDRQMDYAPSPSLLNSPAVAAQANGSVRATTIQGMQQTHGNRAVQRFVHRTPATIAVQRTPEEEALRRAVETSEQLRQSEHPSSTAGAIPGAASSVGSPEVIAGITVDNLRTARDRTGQVSDTVGLTSGMVQGAEELRAARDFGLGSASRARFGGATGTLGGLTGVAGMITGTATALDPTQTGTSRALGGASAVAGLTGTLGWAAPATFAAGGTSGLAAGASTAIGSAGAATAVGSAGAVLGAGLAGLTVGDLLVRGGEWAQERMTGRRTQHFGIGDMTGRDWSELGDFFWNGSDGRGGISHAFGLLPPPDPAPMRSRPAPQQAAPQAPPQQPQEIPAWHPPMRLGPHEDYEQMVSR